MTSTSTDYKPALVQEKILGVVRKRQGEATTADLVALTGLPKAQVEAELPAVADEFGARLKVTESGEILWSFPAGLKSRYTGFLPSLRRAWKAFKKGFVAVASLLFKAWIVLMLVGYFVFFVALIVVAVLASIAISMAAKGDRDSDRGGGGGGLFLAGRLLDTFVRIWFYSELFKGPEARAADWRRRDAKKAGRRPLHKAVFSFVLGEGDPNADWDTVEKKAVVAFLQSNKGIITIHEFMAITGLSPVEAETRINRYLFEFEGEPQVTEEGTIYYSFPSLLRRKDRVDRTYGGTTPMRRLWTFSANPAKANRTFAFFNGFNLLLGGYFLHGALTVPTENIRLLLEILLNATKPVRIADTGLLGGFDFLYGVTNVLFQAVVPGDPATLIAWALGLVPISFSVLFFLVPYLRKQRLEKANEAIETENLRRIVYRSVLSSPSGVRPEAIGLQAAANPKDGRAAERLVVELAAATGGSPGADGSYSFGEIARSEGEAAKARAIVKDSDFDLGAQVFDSHS